MAIVSAEKFVQAARDNGYAVGGFNTNNLEWTQAILRAAEAKQAPILIQTSMGALATTSLAFSRFSSIGRCEPSNITEV